MASGLTSVLTRRRGGAGICVALLLSMAATVNADVVFDNFVDMNGYDDNFVLFLNGEGDAAFPNNSGLAFDFTVSGGDFSLTTIEVVVNDSFLFEQSTYDLTLYADGGGGLPGAALGTIGMNGVFASGAATLASADFSALNITLTDTSTFWVGLEATGRTIGAWAQENNGASLVYATSNGGVFSTAGLDRQGAFRVNGTPSASGGSQPIVPIPPAVLLGALGLGLVGTLKRRF